jgi:hypothetical protein
MLRRTALLAAGIAAVLAAPLAHAQWKWKDASGIVQYSDLPPPPGIADRDILQRPAPTTVARAAPSAAAASAAAPAAPRGVDSELEARRKKTEQDEAARKKAEDERVAAAKADNCTRARSHLRAIDDGLRMARVNAQGEREFLDDKQRAEEARRAREIIAADCR